MTGRTTGAAAGFVLAGIDSARTQCEVAVRVFAPAETVTRAAGRWADVEPLDAEQAGWRCAWTRSTGPACCSGRSAQSSRSVTPPELTDHLRRIGERFVRSTQVLPDRRSRAAHPKGATSAGQRSNATT